MHEDNYKYPILCVNAILCLLLVILEVVSSPPLVIPPIYLVPIFFWLVYAPQLMPLTIIFLIGIVKDLLTGAPVGLTSLVLIVLSVTLVSQAETLKRQVKTTLWGCFAIFTALFYLFSYCLISFMQGQLANAQLHYVSILVLIILYPVIVAGLLQLLKIPIRRVRT